MSISIKRLAIAAMATVSSLGLGACVSTDYVDEQIATVNQRIDALEASQRQTDATATAAAAEAQNANRRLDQLTTRVDRLEQQAAAQRTPRN